ncbi:MAG: alpha-L-arabinofuranosidase C-terminal domain-containing protein [Eubacteriales bacterium]|nr:alpha-L-arabinofuranosidase C-terminal domain-containing protein [Eubacteriales bacterium]
MLTSIIEANQPQERIRREIYGHFAEHLGRCIYGGFHVGEQSVIRHEQGLRLELIEALRRIRIPVLRWPGGCFADEYHWKDGIGPLTLRKKMVNTHWGGDVEDNSFGTHEFLHLCETLDCAPYISGNVGSGTVSEMQEWVEYITSDAVTPMTELRRKNGREKAWKLPFFGVGNESWGCGGNMRADYYADLYRHYQTYVRRYGPERISKIACGASDFNYEWTETLMKMAGSLMDGLSLHYYTVPGDWEHKGSATTFDRDTYYTTLAKALRMDELITGHSAIMDRYDPERRVGLVVDEWGTWYDPEPGTNPGHLYQQNTMRDALVAGLTLNIFNQHAGRVHMANLAQTVNVLQALVLTDEEKMLLTPTYHVFDLYQVHQGAWRLPAQLSGDDGCGPETARVPQLQQSASIDADGRVHLSLCHLSDEAPVSLRIDLRGGAYAVESAWILSDSMTAHNTFDQPDRVRPRPYTAIHTDQTSGQATRLSLEIPPCAVLRLTLSSLG